MKNLKRAIIFFITVLMHPLFIIGADTPSQLELPAETEVPSTKEEPSKGVIERIAPTVVSAASTGVAVVQTAPKLIGPATEALKEELKLLKAGPLRFYQQKSFTGSLERRVKRGILRRPFAFEISAEDQKPFADVAKAAGKTLVPAKIVVVDFSNENIDSFPEFLDRMAHMRAPFEKEIAGVLENLINKMELVQAIREKMATEKSSYVLLKDREEEKALIEEIRALSVTRDTIQKSINLMLPENINVILLARNHIKEIPNNVLTQFHNLASIDLTSNEIKNIGDAAFRGLSNLHLLLLSDNFFNKLPLPALQGCTNLQYINIAKTPLARKFNVIGLPTGKTKIGRAIQKKLIFRSEVDNVRAIKEAFPHTTVHTVAILTRTSFIALIKSASLGTAVLLCVVYGPAIAGWLGIKLPAGASSAVVIKEISKYVASRILIPAIIGGTIAIGSVKIPIKQ